MLDVLGKIEARGALEIAARVKQRCSSIFNYAITKLLVMDNPTHPLRDSFQTPKNKNYARLKIEEMPQFTHRYVEADPVSELLLLPIGNNQFILES
jgi:hypothetical protein